jgi:hypothetical protein
MSRFRWLALMLLLALPLVACTKGNECDRCTTDADCTDGSLCTAFNDGSTRCGSGIGATTCRVR